MYNINNNFTKKILRKSINVKKHERIGPRIEP